MDPSFGDRLPEIRTAVPGPRSVALAERLRKVESPNITAPEPPPIFWTEAAGANVRDADGNVYVDVTAGFGVSSAGHGNPAVAAAVGEQARTLTHAMGDVHPAAVKVELLERLAAVAPGELSVAILSANGGDAVESALKTAVMATDRTGIVAFEGGYHGLGYGALGVSSGAHFRGPFERQLFPGVRFAPFPTPGGVSATAAVDAVDAAIADAADGEHPVGAVVVEPIQGRGGIRVPPDDFLPGLRALCTERDVLLILDEVYTGLGRTGRWFACQHWDVVPDLLVIGKALAGGLPLSAVLGTPAVMAAWPVSTGEAIHTSTFLGNPVTCAAAVAQLEELEQRDLVDRARTEGTWLRSRLEAVVRASPRALSVRGVGLIQALELGDAELAARVARRALGAGLVILPEGTALAFTPPLTIRREQLEWAVTQVEELLAGSDAPGPDAPAPDQPAP